jgi:hypothetical protein
VPTDERISVRVLHDVGGRGGPELDAVVGAMVAGLVRPVRVHETRTQQPQQGGRQRSQCPMWFRPHCSVRLECSIWAIVTSPTVREQAIITGASRAAGRHLARRAETESARFEGYRPKWSILGTESRPTTECDCHAVGSSNTGGRLEVSYDLIFLQSRQCAQQ